MTRNRVSDWLNDRVTVAEPIFGVCRRCMVFSAAAAVLGGGMFGVGLAAETWALTIAGALILSYGGTLCLVHLAFFVARTLRRPRTQS